MKKIMIGVLLACMAVIMSGCDQRNGEQISRVEGLFSLFGSAASEDKCIYEEDGRLYIQDIKTNQSMIFCSKPDCKHEPANEETNPDPECEAALRPGCIRFSSVGLYEDKVYAFEESSKKANEMILYSKVLTGQGWSKIGTIPYGVDDNANSYYADGYAYIAGRGVISPFRIGEANKEECVLLKVNLSNGKYEELGTKYSAEGWCRIQKLDYSDGMLCYEVSRLKEGYTQKDVENLPTSEWNTILDVMVMLVDAGTGKEQKLEFKEELEYDEYVCYGDGIVYYKDQGAVVKWNVKRQQMENTIGEYEEGATVRPYLPVGIMIDTGEAQRLYDIKKKRWLEIKNPEGAATTANNGIDNYTSQYARAHCVIGNKDEDALLCAKWVTWEDYIDGIWMPQKGDSDMVVIGGGENSGAAGGVQVEPVLDDVYYEEHWKGKTILTWWNDFDIPAHIIVKLNDTLLEKGRDYVIREESVENHKDEYFDSLVDARNNREALDIFITPSQMIGEKPENKYEKCVNAGLLEPLTDFLNSDKGRKFYETFYKKQWDAMKVDGDIYSYDWRALPVSDISMAVDRKYLNKYGLTADNSTTMEDVFRMAQEVSEKEKNKSLVPVLWPDVDELSVRQASIEGLSELRDEYREAFCFFDPSNTDAEFTVFAYFQYDNLATLSDEEIVAVLPERHIEQCSRITVKKGSYVPVTNSLTAVASWSEHKEEAMDFIALANTDKDIATILQFGQEGWDYTLEDGRIKNSSDIHITDACNKWITPPYLLEPDDKEAAYRTYIEERLND